jgi:hypothetical protein
MPAPKRTETDSKPLPLRFYSFASRLVYVLLSRSLRSPVPRFAYGFVRSCTVKSDLKSDAYVRVVGLLDDLGRSEERVGPDIDRPVTLSPPSVQ